jgi:hypothetical protein
MTTILREQEEPSRATKNVIMIVSGLAVLVLGLIFVQYGISGLNTPYTCPANQPSCTTTAYVPQFAATFGGFSMILLGSGIFIFRGKFNAAKGIAFGVIVAAIIIAIFLT